LFDVWAVFLFRYVNAVIMNTNCTHLPCFCVFWDSCYLQCQVVDHYYNWCFSLLWELSRTSVQYYK